MLSRIAERLRAVQRGQAASFSVDLSEGASREDSLSCSEVRRCLPGKRLACLAEWRGGTVFAKLFFDPKRASIHWRRELRGVRLLSCGGIAAPSLLYSRALPAEGVYVLLFEFIPLACDYAELWKRAGEEQRFELLRRLTRTLAAHHRAGVLQQDLHFNNFMASGSRTYTLDAADIVGCGAPLDIRASLKHLALLFAQAPPEYDEHLDELLDEYQSSRGFSIPARSRRRFRRWLSAARRKRRNHYLQRAFRECGDFICDRTWRRFSVYQRAYDSPALRAMLADPDSAMDAGAILKPGNTSTVARVVIDGRVLVIKRYNINDRPHALKRAVRRSRAWISWTNAHRLNYYGIATPEPVALVETRWGPFRGKAYFIMAYLPGEDSLKGFREPRDADRERALADRIAESLQRLYRARISHGDLKGTNILIAGGRAQFVDLDAMQEHRLALCFRHHWRRDMRRFLQNWRDNPAAARLFRERLHEFLDPH